ncbi:unnamed protein product [Microthlaspi erraticum]|uniref:Uncharacterized protein n=1 Tax=Microthlaspi erraticum TaxID=1685480 RepID=A0A6D2K6H1_9BRAS|nr:unnamed protein product [Microthlaspi erraticum]
MGREEQGRTWCMDAAQLDTQRKKEEAILKTSSTTTRPSGRVPQLDRPSFNSIELRSQQSNPKNVASPLTSFDPKPNPLAILHMEVMEIVGKGPLRAPITLALEMEFIGVGWISLSNDPMASKA